MRMTEISMPYAADAIPSSSKNHIIYKHAAFGRFPAEKRKIDDDEQG